MRHETLPKEVAHFCSMCGPKIVLHEARSPDGAKRNPGIHAQSRITLPLHPGYGMPAGEIFSTEPDCARRIG